MLTDLKRVELALIPNILLSIFVAGVNDPELEEAKETRRLLTAASLAPVADLDQKSKDKLMRRIVRVHDEVMAPHVKEGMRTDKAGLMAFYLTKAVTESEYLILIEGSELSLALDVFLPAIEHAAQVAELDRSAQKAARKLLLRLQALGYFVGVPPSIQEAA